MKFFRLMLSDDKKKWNTYEVFSVDFYSSMRRISPKDAYPYLRDRELKLYIKVIKKGECPDFASIGSYYLIANASKYDKDKLSFNGLELLDVSVEGRDKGYVVFSF